MSRSGTATLDVGTIGARAPVRWMPLCSAVSEQARPRVVRVRVERASSDDPLWSYGLPAGVWWTPREGATQAWIGDDLSLGECGVLRFAFGTQGMQRRIMCDLRSGDYQLPPCEFLTVEAARYTPGPDVSPTSAAVEVAGEISDGATTDYTPMQYTAPSSWPAPALESEGDSAVIAAPPGAYALELYPDAPGNPGVLELWPPGARRDFTQWVPASSPLPLVSDVVTVRASGGAPQPCRLVFWVR